MNTYSKDWWIAMLHRFHRYRRKEEHKRALLAASIDLSPDDLAEAVLASENMAEKKQKGITYVTELDLCRSYKVIANILLDYAEAHGVFN